MLHLPQLAPRSNEEVFKEGNEEAQIAAQEKELEAKNTAIREWQRNNPIVGKPDAPADLREGAEEEADPNEGSLEEEDDMDGDEEM
ncbi:hypothetical protein GPECTOR_35g839 [Gonium pectorale]|uniref:Uncharacterized protein n=1 Tax=Gonium pectorale TaxID=33097 RepID=A0A150GC21_GONPE|nr:hypothetical protein GPECTOR_35g839 [Gonium pectorale]|eukprot:KXZ47401.1 hypothetical protein GPECTOR_35g839 [Gonium pectorale]